MELFDKSGKQIDKSEVLHVLLKEVLETQLTGVQYDYLDVELLKDSKTLLTPLFVDFDGYDGSTVHEGQPVVVSPD